jgi:hypothetical protein
LETLTHPIDLISVVRVERIFVSGLDKCQF